MKKWICILVCCALFMPAALAAGSDAAADAGRELADTLGTSELERSVPSEARPYVDGLSPGGSADVDSAMQNVVRQAGGQVGGLVKEGVRGLLSVLAVVILCAVASTLYQGTEGRADAVVLAGVLGVTAVSAGQVGNLLQLGRNAVNDMSGFSKVLLPSLAAASAATGQVTAATIRYTTTMLFSDILLTLMSRVFTPLVFAYVAALAAGAALGQDMLTKIAAFIKWTVTGLLTLCLTAFVAYLTLSGAIAGAADATAVKGVRLALSTAVPVVGGIISDAAETVLAGAGIVKNAVGIFGLFAVLGICVVPFLRVGIQYLLYKIMSAAAAPLAGERITKLIDGIGGAFGLILGMTGSAALVLFISLISAISGVSPS